MNYWDDPQFDDGPEPDDAEREAYAVDCYERRCEADRMNPMVTFEVPMGEHIKATYQYIPRLGRRVLVREKP